MEVNVDVKLVQGQIKLLKNSLHNLNVLYKELGNGFQDMQSWNDAKSQEAKGIVASCGKDIQKMGKAMNEAIKGLEKILQPLLEYENTNLYNASVGGTSHGNSESTYSSSHRVGCYDDLPNDSNGNPGPEKEAILAYTGDDYSNINRSLWDPNTTATPENSRRIDIMSNTLRNASLSRSCRVYRGTDRSALGYPLNTLQNPQDMVGMSFANDAFMSVSADAGVADYFARHMSNSRYGPVIISFDAHEGDHAIDISGRGHHPSESEILYNAGMVMTVENAREENGILYVDVRLDRRYYNER